MFKAFDWGGQPLHSFGDEKGRQSYIWWQCNGKIIGIGQVSKKDSTNIEDILLVDGLKHNLLNVSQLCDKVI